MNHGTSELLARLDAAATQVSCLENDMRASGDAAILRIRERMAEATTQLWAAYAVAKGLA